MSSYVLVVNGLLSGMLRQQHSPDRLIGGSGSKLTFAILSSLNLTGDPATNLRSSLRRADEQFEFDPAFGGWHALRIMRARIPRR